MRIFEFGGAAEQDAVGLRSLEKAEGNAPGAQQALGAQSEVAHELRQMQDVVEFERDRNQGLGAAAVFLGLVEITG